MRRLGLIPLMLIFLIAWVPQAHSPQSLSIGIIMHQLDAVVWPISQYELPLEADLDLLPVSDQFPEERLPNPETDRTPLFDLSVVEASSVEEQIAAIDQFIQQAVDGLVIMPISENEILTAALQRAIDSGIPVVFAQRGISALDSPRTAYVGLEYYQLGYAIGKGALGVTAQGIQKYPLEEEDRFLLLMKDSEDYIEKRLAEGFTAAVGDHLAGTHEVNATDSYAFTQRRITELPNLNSIFMTHVDLSTGVLEAVQEVALPGNQIRTVSYGAMPDYRRLIRERGYNGVATQDVYGMILKSLVQLKKLIVHNTPLCDEFIEVELHYRFHLPYGTFTPYPYESPIGIDLLWMWWFG